MRVFVCVAAAAAAVMLCSVHALPAPAMHLPHRRRAAAWYAPPASRLDVPDGGVAVVEAYLDQHLDHFEPVQSQGTTWKQRYFLRDDLFKAGGPVFLCVGGEGPPLTKAVLTASVHCNDAVELASQVGALLVALEHRFYGKSHPTLDFSTDSLRLLSANQALADIAAFHGFVTALPKYNLTAANKWVTFGGSYPGMLSGWSRYKFPHLFHASVASSAPVEAVLDYPQYQDVVAASMADAMVGGSDECLAVITNGHATIGTQLKTAAGRQALAQQFNLCNTTALDDANNQADWAGNGVVYLPVQENDPACTTPQCNISGVCEYLLDSANGATPVDRLAALSAVQHGQQCVPLDHQASVKALQNTTLEGGVDRIWFYETCTLFGYYQTCEENTTCPYTRGLALLSSFTDLCVSSFGIEPATTAARIQFSLDYWGGRTLQGSRIMFPNGDVDPWHSQGVLVSPNPQEPVLMVKGASHHFWTHPSKPTDSPQVVAARQAIWKQVKAWLA